MTRPRKKSPRITVACAHDGCGKTQTLRPSRIDHCDGYVCGPAHGPKASPGPGLVRELVMGAAGGFWGWRDVPAAGEIQAAAERARRLALFAQAQALPKGRVDQLVRALIGPCGPGSRSILTVNEMSTGIIVDETGRPEIELPNVAGAFRLMHDQGHSAGVLLRTFTDRTAFTTGPGLRIPLRELRGWAMRGGRLFPLTAAEVFDAHCADAETGEPLPLERGVAYRDAWEVTVPAPPP